MSDGDVVFVLRCRHGHEFRFLEWAAEGRKGAPCPECSVPLHVDRVEARATVVSTCGACDGSGIDPLRVQRHTEQHRSTAGTHDEEAPCAACGGSGEALLVTASGRVLVDADIERLAAEAERGYDVEHLKGRMSRARERRGPTGLGR